MNASTDSRNTPLIRTTTIRSIAAAVLVGASLATPAPASAGILDSIKSRVDAIYSQVRSIRNQVAEMIAGMNETKDAFRSGGAREMLNSVTSTLDFLQESRAQYQEFSGPNDCDHNSPCGVYRDNLHQLIDDVIALPGELPFVDDASSRGDRLEKVLDLIDKVPTPMLYVSEQVTGNVIERFLLLTGTIRSVAAELPDFPSLEELHAMSDRDFYATCEIINSSNPHIVLLGVLLDNAAGTIDDLAGLLPGDKVIGITAVGGAVMNLPHPATATFKQVVMVLKSFRRNLNYRVALVTSGCAIAGFEATT